MQNIFNFTERKSNLQEIANFGNYPRDFRLLSEDREKQFKIGSLPDYPEELTALTYVVTAKVTITAVITNTVNLNFFLPSWS